MNHVEIVSGVLVDDATLTINELANACSVEVTWVEQRVQDGVLVCAQATTAVDAQQWRFASAALVRARRLVDIERTFDANPEITALVVDLLEEVADLRNQLGMRARRG
jgi:chaperone modulatory protein CbpM